MTEQNKARPFAVGDFVVIRIGGHKPFKAVVTEVLDEKHLIFAQQIMSAPQCYSIDYIKTIRTSRKGGKEARDIVAMLYKDVANQRRHIHFSHKMKGIKATYEDIKIAHDDVYYGLKIAEKAKAMLGASDDNDN